MKNEPSGGGDLPKARPTKEVPFSGGGHLRNLHDPIIVGLGMSSKMEKGSGNRLNETSPQSELKLLGCLLLDVSLQMNRAATLFGVLTSEDVLTKVTK